MELPVKFVCNNPVDVPPASLMGEWAEEEEEEIEEEEEVCVCVRAKGRLSRAL